jgi:hypothetical protein
MLSVFIIFGMLFLFCVTILFSLSKGGVSSALLGCLFGAGATLFGIATLVTGFLTFLG